MFNADRRLQINAARYAYPDIMVSCDPEDVQSESVHSPVVIFEVLSPSTASFDRGQKGDYYRAMPNIKEYVLIDQHQPYVQVQRRHNDSTLWTLESYGEGDTITLASLNITILVADIYRKSVFPSITAPGSPETPAP